MKTRQYITAMLIALIFGLVSIQAQSARREAPKQNKERATAIRATPQKARAVEATRPAPQKARAVEATRPAPQKARTVQANKPAPQKARTVQANKPAPQKARTIQANKPAPQKARTVEPTRSAPKQQVKQPAQRQRTVQPANQAQRQRTVQPASKPVSISTPNNPRSTYRNNATTLNTREIRTIPARVNQYSTKRYYSGNHYHYIYPTRSVNIHFHHDTYVHNYRVLYYPVHTNIFWTRSMYRDYRVWYPGYSWSYYYGYRLNTISIFEAKYNLGEVAMVYGRVYATWYNTETDDYLLFFGGDYPYQEFTVVLPGRVARRFSWRPERYFLGEHLTVTGLITTFDGIPEIIVKNKRQVGLY